MKSKIVKKKDLDVLIESTLNKAGISKEVKTKKIVTESKKTELTKKNVTENKEEDKSLINEELIRFNKLTNYTYKK